METFLLAIVFVTFNAERDCVMEVSARAHFQACVSKNELGESPFAKYLCAVPLTSTADDYASIVDRGQPS